MCGNWGLWGACYKLFGLSLRESWSPDFVVDTNPGKRRLREIIFIFRVSEVCLEDLPLTTNHSFPSFFESLLAGYNHIFLIGLIASSTITSGYRHLSLIRLNLISLQYLGSNRLWHAPPPSNLSSLSSSRNHWNLFKVSMHFYIDQSYQVFLLRFK